MLAEVDGLWQRVELQERRLKEVEGEKVALDAQLSSATGQLRHAREKATENIRRCVCRGGGGGVHVRTHVHACMQGLFKSDRCQSMYVRMYIGTSSIYVCTPPVIFMLLYVHVRVSPTTYVG